MRKALLLTCTLFAALFVGCTQNDIDHSMVTSDGPRLYAHIEEDTDSRVQLNAYLKTVWNHGDEILVLGDQRLESWVFNGADGSRNAQFDFNSAYDDYGVDFSDRLYAHYPLDNHDGMGEFEDGTPALFLYVLDYQEYTKGSYDPKSNNMIGESEDGTNFYFKNMLGYLRISLVGEGAVKSITLSGNNDEYIAGLRYYALPDTSLSNWYDEEVYTSIVLDCGNGVALSSEPTDFYFALAPTTFDDGINIEVEMSDGTISYRSTTKFISVARNTIVPMQTLNIDGNLEWQSVTVTYNAKEITAPTIEGTSSLFGYIYWGDDTNDSINSESSHVYYDNQTTHTLTIEVINATAVEFSDCSGITDIDFSNF